MSCCCTARHVHFDVSSSQSNQRVFLRVWGLSWAQLHKFCGGKAIAVSGQRLRISPKSLPAMPALVSIERNPSVTQRTAGLLAKEGHAEGSTKMERAAPDGCGPAEWIWMS